MCLSACHHIMFLCSVFFAIPQQDFNGLSLSAALDASISCAGFPSEKTYTLEQEVG